MDVHIHIPKSSLASLALGCAQVCLRILKLLFLCFLETPVVNKFFALNASFTFCSFKDFLVILDFLQFHY